MSTKLKALLGATIVIALAAGCSPSDPGQVQLKVPQPGEEGAPLTYVAIGGSLMAGFMDAGLIADTHVLTNGQFASVPFRISSRLGYTGSTGDRPFWQPLVAPPGLGSTDTGTSSRVAGVLRFDAGAGEIALLGTTAADSVMGLLLAATLPVPYDNLSVPGATLYDLDHALTSSSSQVPDNSYFDAILRNPSFGNVTMLGQAAAKGPTLVTLWIGETDVLGGARTGTPVVGQNVTPGPVFTALLLQTVTDLQARVQARFGWKPVVVIGNLPRLQTIPYFVPKAVFDQVIGVALATEEDNVAYVLFPTLGEVTGPSYVIPATSTLTVDEAAVVTDAITAYNAAIQDVASTTGATVVDIDALFAAQPTAALTHFLFLLGQGATIGQAAATTIYSLDGLHPNSQGYSLVANAFIDGINAAFDLTGDAALAHVAVLDWDPLYGSFLAGATPPAPGHGPALTPAAAAALRAMAF